MGTCSFKNAGLQNRAISNNKKIIAKTTETCKKKNLVEISSCNMSPK